MPRLRQPQERPTPEPDPQLQAQNPEQEEEIPHPGEETLPFEEKVEKKEEAEEPVLKTEEEDPSAALKKQIEALKRSEAIARSQVERERDEALRRLQEYEAEVGKSRKEVVQSQHEAISTALGAAQQEAESAKRDIKQSIVNGDVDAQVEAQERLATARANISRLEDGKLELESRISAPEEPKKPQTPTVESTINDLKIPEVGKSFLREHPEFLTNPSLNIRIQNWHIEAIEDKGFKPFDDDYMDYINERAGFKEPEVEPEVQPQPKKAPIVSAPVSREPPSTPTSKRGTYTLNALQREAARMAGITDLEYAKQLQKLNEMKANGSYGEQR